MLSSHCGSTITPNLESWLTECLVERNVCGELIQTIERPGVLRLSACLLRIQPPAEGHGTGPVTSLAQTLGAPRILQVPGERLILLFEVQTARECVLDIGQGVIEGLPEGDRGLFVLRLRYTDGVLHIAPLEERKRDLCPNTRGGILQHAQQLGAGGAQAPGQRERG